MLKFLYYTALILGLYFVFKYIIKILLVLIAHNVKKKMFGNNLNTKSKDNYNEINKTINYKEKKNQKDDDIIEFEEE
jgi:hypothetical protein